MRDPGEGSTVRQILGNTLALLPVSLLPTLMGLAGGVYFFGALALGLLFLGAGVTMALQRTSVAARRLLRVSLVYLPALLILLTLDSLPVG